MHTIKK